MENLIALLLLLAVVWFAAAYLVRLVGGAWPTVTVYEFQKALRFVNGRLAAEHGPGRYRIRRATTTLVVADLRPFLLRLSGQEVLTADAVPVRLGLSLSARIESPLAALRAFAPPPTETDQTPEQAKGADVASWSGLWNAVYEAAHGAVREAVGRRTIEQILADRDGLVQEIRALVADRVQGCGARLEDLRLRDLSLPGELKRAFSQVPAAREEARAALERARGEQAALRSLANAARMLDGNESLALLRSIQAIQASGGQLVVRLEPGGHPPAEGGELPG
ncbi:MAG: SPFH domain-containing protein [Fimbriimonadales bacterium]